MTLSGPYISATQIIRFEWLVLLSATACALLLKNKLKVPAIRLSRSLSTIASRKRIAVLLVALLPITLRLALLPMMPPPQVQVEEEAANLLQADTLSHLRLANPPLEHWEHFDTMQVLQRPYYVSMRPPGYSVFLAAGQRLFGNPWAGVCLTVAVLCAAVCWMLQGWFSPSWALFGAALLAVRMGVLSYWMNSYWGGAISAAGGALVLGAYIRLRRRPRRVWIIPLCVGIAMLVTTRIYEGALFLLPIGLALVFEFFRKSSRGIQRKVLAEVFVYTFCFGVLVTAWFAYYNWRTTGSAFTATYSLGRKTQNIAPAFVFGAVQPMHNFSSREMLLRYAGWEMWLYNRNTSWPGWTEEQSWRALTFWSMYIRPLLTIPLLAALFCWRNRVVQFSLIVLLFGLCGSFLTVWGPSYYYASFLPALIILVVQGIRRLRTLKIRDAYVVPQFAGVTFAVALVVLSGLVVLRAVHGHVVGEDIFQWASYENRMPHRGEVEKWLDSKPGKHLVFVHYRQEHNVLCEWVFNQADLFSSRIVWAREYDSQRNRELLEHFPDREVWIVDADLPASLPKAYSPAPSPSTPTRFTSLSSTQNPPVASKRLNPNKIASGQQ